MDREQVEVRSSTGTPTRIDRLREEHALLETRLENLNGLVYLTPAEQFERKRIQKLKLQKKDLLAHLMGGNALS